MGAIVAAVSVSANVDYDNGTALLMGLLPYLRQGYTGRLIRTSETLSLLRPWVNESR